MRQRLPWVCHASCGSLLTVALRVGHGTLALVLPQVEINLENFINLVESISAEADSTGAATESTPQSMVSETCRSAVATAGSAVVTAGSAGSAAATAGLQSLGLGFATRACRVRHIPAEEL